MTENFPIDQGVKQGDDISSSGFNGIIDGCVNVNSLNKGINAGAVNFSIFSYAHIMAVIALRYIIIVEGMRLLNM